MIESNMIENFDEIKQYYPCLKIWKDNMFPNYYVVLFTQERTGIVVCSSKNNSVHQVGFYSDSFLESEFEIYQHTITLKNI